MLDADSLRVQTAPFDRSIDLLSILRSRGDADCFYWEHPDSGLTIAALGAVARFEAAGPGRFDDVSRSARAFLSNLGARSNHIRDDNGPIVVGGFGFSDSQCSAYPWREFPPLRMVVPEMLLIRRGTQCTLTRIWRGNDERRVDDLLAHATSAKMPRSLGSQPWVDILRSPDMDRCQWRARVERVRARIFAGDLRKVVLSRWLELDAARPLDPALILKHSREIRRSCVSFCVSSAETAFVGSSPELLLRVERGCVTSGALAGSAPRGASNCEDDRLGRELLASSKNREEHQLVVSAVRAALDTVADPVTQAVAPQLMRLPEAQHLFTPVQGLLRDRRSVLEVGGILHPTPAVCGTPRDAARAIIEREEHARGWYTGAVGWMDGCGQGEFAVALRSGLIDGRKMYVWAGAGIVRGSDPDLEFDETENKMTALLGNWKHGHAA